MSILKVISITDLPTEVIEHIAKFLSLEDIEACARASEELDYKLNINSIWKRFCLYPEKYFKANTEERLQAVENYKHWCDWRKYCELQKRVGENWKKGIFSVENTGIQSTVTDVNCLFFDFVYDHGRHWLFIVGNGEIIISDITNTFRIHCRVTVSFPVLYIRNGVDKIAVCGLHGFVEVYEFKAPQYKMICEYKFQVDKEGVLPNDYEFQSNLNERSDVYICHLLGHYLISYKSKNNDLRNSFFYIWDLKSATKISPTPNAFHQSYVEFVRTSTGKDISKHRMNGYMELNPVDFEQFLIELSPEDLDVTQFSLFSLREMKMVKVIAQIHGEVKGLIIESDQIISIFSDGQCDRIAFYNIHGKQLTDLQILPLPIKEEFPSITFGNKLRMSMLHNFQVFNILDNRLVYEMEIDPDEIICINCCINPRILVLEDQLLQNLYFVDIDTGVKLWTLNTVDYSNFLDISEKKYPRKIIVKFKDKNEYSILNFEEVGIELV